MKLFKIFGEQIVVVGITILVVGSGLNLNNYFKKKFGKK
jgi:hypothetical protein